MGSSRDDSEILSFPSLLHTVFLPGPSKCEVERYSALRYQHTYIPSCDADGGYTPVQCQQGGQCWCVDCYAGECWCLDTSGKEVPGSRVQGERPRCPTDSGDSGT
uniref:Thyroglobulin type-1 domain-containing protein n=1 Tax=Otus sunia TaxID=257818 RepID=A0A8C8AVA8_9STRI